MSAAMPVAGPAVAVGRADCLHIGSALAGALHRSYS